MIFKGSRYSNTVVVNAPGADGQERRTLAARRIDAEQGVLEHTVSEGERLDQLAARFYGEPTKYWLLLDANPDILNPFELLVPGRVVRVPRNRIVSG